MPYETDGNSNDFLPYDLTGAYADADWAWFNAIANSGNTSHQWRTLTFLEWIYLLEERTNNTNLGTANARFAKGVVNNVYGVILFPDGYTHPSTVTSPTDINSTTQGGWLSNFYTPAEWAQMEAAGAVFLPAAGTRWGTTYSDGNIGGYYWSSTHEHDGSTGAHILRFYSGALNTHNDGNPQQAISVRPVKDAD